MLNNFRTAFVYTRAIIDKHDFVLPTPDFESEKKKKQIAFKASYSLTKIERIK